MKDHDMMTVNDAFIAISKRIEVLEMAQAVHQKAISALCKSVGLLQEVITRELDAAKKAEDMIEGLE